MHLASCLGRSLRVCDLSRMSRLSSLGSLCSLCGLSSLRLCLCGLGSLCLCLSGLNLCMRTQRLRNRDLSPSGQRRDGRSGKDAVHHCR